jgi:hypothetical protein
MRKLVSLLLVLFLVSAPGALASESVTHEGPGFASPEDAVHCYLEGLRNGDVQQMLSAFAIETYVDHYDIIAACRRQGSYNPNSPIGMPNSSPLWRNINIESRRGDLVKFINFQARYYSLPPFDFSVPYILKKEIVDEKTVEFFPGANGNKLEITEFFSYIDGSKAERSITDLKFDSFIEPVTLIEEKNDKSLLESYLGEEYQSIIAKQMLVYGADEFTGVACLLTNETTYLGEESYLLCFDAARYGNLWYLHTFQGSVGLYLNISPLNGGLLEYPDAKFDW